MQRTIGNRTASHLVLAKTAEKTALSRPAAGDEPMLRYGSQSNAVKMPQHYLAQAGADIEADGIFGAITHRAEAAFQKSNGLDVDRIASPQPPDWAAGLSKLGRFDFAFRLYCGRWDAGNGEKIMLRTIFQPAS